MANKPYLIFSLNDLLYGVEAFCVQEIFSLPNLTPIAEAPREIVGVVNLRGDILPVMDLNLRFGYQQLEYSLTDSVIILEWQGFRIGIIVERVHEVHNISPQDITTEILYRQDVTNLREKFVAGIAKLAADIVMLVNHENLLSYSNYGEFSVAEQIKERPVTSEKDAIFSDNYYPKHRTFCPHATPEERAIFRERAENLIQQTQGQDFTGLIPLAVVALNDEFFGLDLSIVREFTELRQVTPVPCCPPHIVGNMNLRGEILTLVDIRSLLNLPMLDGETTTKVMIVRIDDLVTGVTVDEVFDVMYLHPSQILPVPTAVHSINNEYLRGTAAYREKMMSILDLSKIFRQGDLIVNEEV